MAYRRQRRGDERQDSAADRALRELRQEVARVKGQLSVSQRNHRLAERASNKPDPNASKASVGGAAGLGVAASGTKEVLDWLWEIMRPKFPFLYDFLHLDPIDAGIMAMVSAFFVWIGGRKK